MHLPWALRAERRMSGAGRQLLCVFNDDPYANHTDKISVPKGITRAVSLFDSSEVAVKKGKLKVSLESDDTQVYELF